MNPLKVYLSGEIHSSWREEIIAASKKKELNIEFYSPVTDHAASDAAGDVLGKPDTDFWRDHQSAKINAIRTQTMMKNCDFAVIRFGDKFKQWNAAFDAGFCAALGKPFITLHVDDIEHPLKEVDANANARAKTVEQVVDILSYILPR